MKTQLRLFAVFTVSFFILVLLTIVLFNEEMNKQIEPQSPERVFEIPRGAGLAWVVSELQNQQVLRTYPIVFQIYARLTSAEGHVKAGEYLLPQTLSHKEMLRLFRSGQVVQYAITFPEGVRCSEWLVKIHDTEGLTAGAVEPDCQNLMELLGKPGMKAEGQLYPDTYHFTKGDSDLDILRRAHLSMEAALANAWNERDDMLPFSTPYEALIVASIVEKETGAGEDRPTIASVFVNRLKKGMKLQSDPTIIYGMENYDGNIRRKHIEMPTPYNTYVISGLPPTPICNPGLASIKATLSPPGTEYLYFVAKGDGRSYFSKSLEEHNRAVRKYQLKNRPENYKSVPDDGN